MDKYSLALRRALGSPKRCPLPECSKLVSTEKGIINHCKTHNKQNLLNAAFAIQANARLLTEDEEATIGPAPSAGVLIMLNLCGFVQFDDNFNIVQF